MSVNVKSKVNLRHICRRWGLLFVSLLFVALFVSSGCVSLFSQCCQPNKPPSH